MSRLALRLPALAACVLLAGAAPAAADRYVALRGAPAAGPARYDRVWVDQIGPRRAHRVLVLVPGFAGGAGLFAPVAHDLVRRVPDLQVWALDRREQAFEDNGALARGDPDAALDHYLGPGYRPLRQSDAPFAARWGLAVSLADLRRLIRSARAGGRRQVILGGHSWGAATAASYAGWDFGGTPGWSGLSGLVLIDGGLGVEAGPRLTPAGAAARLRAIARAPFTDILGLGRPDLAASTAELMGLLAARRPSARSAIQQRLGAAPGAARVFPPFPVTNEALLGYVFDRTYAPPGFAFATARMGRLAASGDPRPWRAGERTPIARFARTLAAQRPDALEWYFPQRLALDLAGAATPAHGAVARRLGLREWHLRSIPLSLYAFQTDLTGGAVLRRARALVRGSRVRRAACAQSDGMSQLDPLVAAPRRNRFLLTVVPWLRRLPR